MPSPRRLAPTKVKAAIKQTRRRLARCSAKCGRRGARPVSIGVAASFVMAHELYRPRAILGMELATTLTQ